jgi:single-strand DNA-binding protein
MASFNKVILVGNLTRDPELRYTPKGTAIAKFGLAVNRVWTSESGEKKEEVTLLISTRLRPHGEKALHSTCAKGARCWSKGA